MALLWWLWLALRVQLLVWLIVTKAVVGGFGDTFLSRELEIWEVTRPTILHATFVSHLSPSALGWSPKGWRGKEKLLPCEAAGGI